MIRRANNFQIVIYEAHLLGDIRKCLKLLDNSGKYFYIKHSEDDVLPHYHVYFSSNGFTDEIEIEAFFLEHIASSVFVEPAKMGKYPFITYMLQNDKYKIRDIKGTLSLA